MHLVASLALLVTLVAAPPAPAQDFPVSGRFTYADKEWDYAGWTGERPERPIRGADVSVLDDATGKLLGRGVTDDDGSFLVQAKARHPLTDIVVRVEARNRMRRKLVGPQTGVTLVSDANTVYAAFSQVFPAHGAGVALDVGTTVADPLVIGGSEGNPFNIFDCAISAFECVTGPVLGATPRGAVTLRWPSLTGSWAYGRHAQIDIGDADDDAVVLHEIGHLVHNLYSDSDSPGGIHYFGDSDQDPRLSLAEGFATFFSGCVQQSLGREALYVDADASESLGGFELRLRLEDCAPYASSVEGASDEIAVAGVLNDLADDALSPDSSPGADDDSMGLSMLIDGVAPSRALWAVFAGPVRRARGLTMDHIWDGWLSEHADDTHYAELHDVFEGQRMRFWTDAFEPDGTPDLATLVTPMSGSAWGAEHTLYDAAPGAATAGTGDRDWFAVELSAGQVIRVETRYPGGAWDARTQADTYLRLRTPGGAKAASDEDSGPGRNARIDAFGVSETGRWLFEVRTRNKTHRYGRYEARVVILSGP